MKDLGKEELQKLAISQEQFEELLLLLRTNHPLALMSKRDIAALFRVHTWTVDEWRRKSCGFPDPIWLSNTTARWRRADIEAWLVSRRRGGVSPDWDKRPTMRRRKRSR